MQAGTTATSSTSSTIWRAAGIWTGDTSTSRRSSRWSPVVVRVVLGQSLAAIRLLPALAGVAEVLLTALIARELGGKRFAQALAAMAALVAPGILGADGILTMNAFEPWFWMGCAYLLIRLIKTENTKLWIWFGILAGFGLENKYSMLIFGAGLVLGLLLSRRAAPAAEPMAVGGRR